MVKFNENLVAIMLFSLYSEKMIKKAIAINTDYITPLGLIEIFLCSALSIEIVVQAFTVAR